MATKTVTVQKTFTLLQKAQNLDIQWKDAVRDIGPYLDGSKPGSGLSIAERNLLMPLLLNMDPNERGYNEACQNYFANLFINVTNKLDLEVGLKDNNKPLSIDNMPEDVEDYVKYKFLLAHPYYRKEGQEHNCIFEIIDHSEIEKERTNELSQGVRYMNDFVKLIEDPEKCKMILVSCSAAPKFAKFRKNYDLMTIDQIKADITELNQMAPDLVNKQYHNKELLITSWISLMVQRGVLELVGDTYVNSNKDIIAHSKAELVMFFKNKQKNQSMINILKAEAKIKDVD